MRPGLQKSIPPRRTVFFSVLLIIALGFAVYGNALNGPFLWDDVNLVKKNVCLRSWSRVPDLFASNIFAGSGGRSNFYRPLQMLTYKIDNSLWKSDIRGYHLSNIVFHVLAASMVYALVNALFGDNVLALLTGLFFVIHPVHVEAVAYVSGRADPLALAFLLMSFVFYLRYVRSSGWGNGLLMLGTYLMALLSKELSLILPLLFLVYHYSFKVKVEAKKILPALAATFLYLLLRLTLLAPALAPQERVPTTLSQRTAGFFVALLNYVRLLWLPFDLHMEYVFKSFSFSDPRVISGMLIFVFLLFFAFNQRKTNALVFFSISWFLVTLAPVSNIYPINAYMAEHWLYQPSVGYFLVLAAALNFLRGKAPKVFAVLSASLLLFYSFLTIRQNNIWRDPMAFYKRTLAYAPESWKVYNNLGTVASDQGNTDEAIAAYKRAIELKPDYAESYYNLGNVYSQAGRNAEAVELYKKAQALNPDQAEIYNSLGTVYKEAGKTEEALASYKKAIELNPGYAKAYYNLGKAYKDAGSQDEAVRAYQKAAELDPDYAEAYYNLGNIYRQTNKNDEAIAAYKKAIALNPDFLEAYNNLGMAYAAVGREEEAVLMFEKLVSLAPRFAKGYYNLAVLSWKAKRYDLAIRNCDKAQELGYKVNPQLLEALKPYRTFAK